MACFFLGKLSVDEYGKAFSITKHCGAVNGVTRERVSEILAGFIILAIFNFLLIILSGSRGALEEAYGENKDLGIASYPRTASNVNTEPAIVSLYLFLTVICKLCTRYCGLKMRMACKLSDRKKHCMLSILMTIACHPNKFSSISKHLAQSLASFGR